MARLARYTLVFAAVLIGCSDPASSDPDAGVNADTSLPPARTDRATRVGSDTTIDIATWNIQNFPKSSTTPETAADLIASLDLDLVAVQEIQNLDRFYEIVARLPGYDSVLSNHAYGDGTFQKVGYIYRADLLTVTDAALLFQNNGYEFPRPPLKVHVSLNGTDFDFDAIVIHLKAGFGGEDAERRTSAIQLLEGNVRGSVDGSGDEDVIILGDYNDTIDQGASVVAPFLDASRYRFETEDLAAADDYTFIPSRRLIDHIVTSAALADELVGGETLIPDLLTEVDGYTTTVSDHLPVVLKLPMP